MLFLKTATTGYSMSLQQGSAYTVFYQEVCKHCKSWRWDVDEVIKVQIYNVHQKQNTDLFNKKLAAVRIVSVIKLYVYTYILPLVFF